MQGGVVPSLLAVGLFALHPGMQQFTSWNLALTALATPLRLPHQALLLNSVSVWVGFHLGGTDGAKRRLMARKRLRSVPLFMALDFAGHAMPVLWWLRAWRRAHKGRIQPWHVGLQTAWAAWYYAAVVRGFNAERQYGRYPWRRQLAQAVLLPTLTMHALNSWRTGDRRPAAAVVCYVWLAREYFDLCDDWRRHELSEGSAEDGALASPSTS